jgi:hypothetical protein
MHAAGIGANAVVDNHQIIAVQDFKPVFAAMSAMAGKCVDGVIGAASAELIQHGTMARGTAVNDAGARLPGDDVLGVLARTSTPAAGDANLSLPSLQIYRRARLVRCSDSGHGDTYPRRRWRRQTCAASLRGWLPVLQISPGFSRGEGPKKKPASLGPRSRPS